MKIRKSQLRRIIKEEGQKLQEAGVVDTGEMMSTVSNAILELFVLQGEVRTTDVFDHLKMNGYADADIDMGLERLGREY